MNLQKQYPRQRDGYNCGVFVIAFGRVIANHHEANWEEAVKNAEVTAMHCIDLRRTILELLLALPTVGSLLKVKSMCLYEDSDDDSYEEEEEEVGAGAPLAVEEEEAARVKAAEEEAARLKAVEEEAARLDLDEDNIRAYKSAHGMSITSPNETKKANDKEQLGQGGQTKKQQSMRRQARFLENMGEAEKKTRAPTPASYNDILGTPRCTLLLYFQQENPKTAGSQTWRLPTT